MSRVNNQVAITKMRDWEPFDNNSGSLSGGRRWRGWGRLTPRDSGAANDFYLRDGVVFWVYSYDTPIAWIWDNGRVDMPRVWLGERSAYHQLLAAHALGVKDFEWPQVAP